MDIQWGPPWRLAAPSLPEADEGRIHLASDRHYSKPLIQSQRGRRSSSCSATHRIFSSRAMACSRRSFASSMRPVTVAQRASFKKIDASVGCQAHALRRTVSSCSTFPTRLTAWASRIHVVGFFGSAFTRSAAIATAISQFSAARHISFSSVRVQPTNLFSYLLKFLFYVPRINKSVAATQRSRVWSFHCFKDINPATSAIQGTAKWPMSDFPCRVGIQQRRLGQGIEKIGYKPGKRLIRPWMQRR